MVLISTYLQFDSTYTFKDLEHEKYSTIFAIVMIIFSLVLTPIAFIYLVTQNINMYQSHKFTSRYGSLFEGIDIRNKWSAAFYLIFMLRRILIVIIAFEGPEFDAI